MSAPESDSASTGIAPVFAALGDPTRLGLISRLLDGEPRSISRLSDGISLTRQAVSKHLRVLEQAGIVTSERVGRESLYVFKPGGIDEARRYLETASIQWDQALSRLKMFVEE